MASALMMGALLAQSVLTTPDGVPSGGSGVQWTLLASDEEADHLIDPGSIRSEGGLTRFRIRQVRKPFRPAFFHSAIVAYQLDCAGRTLTMEEIESFDAAGRSLTARTIPEDWRTKQAIYAATSEEKFFRRVCPDSARARLRDRPPPPPIMIVPTPPPPIQAVPMAPPPLPSPPPPPRPPSPRPLVQHAVPVVPLGSLFSADDYPAAALRSGEEGIVRYRLTIGRDGRVTRCTVTGSSGSVSLDAVTCRLVTARARFRPARNARGKKITDEIDGRIIWRFPDEPVPPGVPPAQPNPQ